MELWQTARFERTYKKLDKTARDQVDAEIRRIRFDPSLGEKKVGDLGEFYVHKFRFRRQSILLAYRINPVKGIELVDLGSHENFYKGLKRRRRVVAGKKKGSNSG